MSIQVEPPKRRTPVDSPASVTRRRANSSRAASKAATRSIAHRGRHTSPRGDGFGKFTGVTLLSIFPGLGLVAAGRRRLGSIIVLGSIITLIILALIGLGGNAVNHALDIATNPTKLALAAGALVLLAAAWCMTVVAAAWRAKPIMPTTLQRIFGSGLVCVTCLAVAAPGMVGAKYAVITRKTLTSVGADSAARVSGAAVPDAKKKDPWANQPRVNLLLLGSDAGADRTGTRTDSMMVASIDTKSGKTTLIGLPRSLQKAPFPADNPLYQKYPNGFQNCSESSCLLNAIWREADTNNADLFKDIKNPGLYTIRGVISEITGLRIDAYTVINLSGFKSLVNAMGGVTVNVTQRLPIGSDPITGWVEPGKRKLDGEEALWFSRSRKSTDDYDRMRRQRCMVGNLVDQANPTKLLAAYPELSKVVQDNIETDIPPSEFKAWAILVKRMQSGGIQSLPLTSSVINTVNPDFDQIRQFIDEGLNPAPSEKSSAGGPDKPAVSASASPTEKATSEAPTDLTKPQENDAVC